MLFHYKSTIQPTGEIQAAWNASINNTKNITDSLLYSTNLLPSYTLYSSSIHN